MTNFDIEIRKLNPILDLIYESLIQFMVGVEGHVIDSTLVQSLNKERDMVNALDTMHYNFVHGRRLINSE